MIKDWVARAMQIACIAEENEIQGIPAEEIIKKLHRRERILNYTIPNWNIQEILRIRTIKEHHGIPEDDLEAQETHQVRIERELINAGMRLTRHEDCDSVENIHSLDWMVFKNRDRVDWNYAGSAGKRGGILKRLEGGKNG